MLELPREETLRLFLGLDVGGHGGDRIGGSGELQDGDERVPPAAGGFDPMPAAVQVTLATTLRHIYPATFAWGAPVHTLGDPRPRRDRQDTTPVLSGMCRTEPRRFQLKAMGLIGSDVFFEVNAPPDSSKVFASVGAPRPTYQ
jgi:hypothetical protein